MVVVEGSGAIGTTRNEEGEEVVGVVEAVETSDSSSISCSTRTEILLRWQA
jgi:hypothetical protein